MKKVIRTCLIAALCVAIVVGYYYYLSHKDDGSSAEETTELTEVDKIITKDFDKDYPSTPRGVVKWYNRIVTAYYAEDYTDEELEQMADQARKLLDEELLSYNSEEDYLTSLKADIADYEARDKQILQSSVSDSSDITYATVNGDYCAYVNAYYFCREGSDYSRTYEEYVLRRDEDGKWKILAFQLTEGEQE
jgi:hypothetical protein